MKKHVKPNEGLADWSDWHELSVVRKNFLTGTAEVWMIDLAD
jgi:hypothetical protein